MKELTTLEKRVLEMLLSGQDEVLAILRRQAQQLAVSARRMTGAGFYTELLVRRGAPRVPGNPTFKLGDVNGTAENVSHGLGFLLFVTDGVLSMLEGYAYDEPWPDDVRGLVLSYSPGPERKLNFPSRRRR